MFLRTDQHRVDTLGLRERCGRHAQPGQAGRHRHPVRPGLQPDDDLHPCASSCSLLPLARGAQVPWAADLVGEFHGHHFPYPQRMLRTDRFKPVVNPDSVNELYTLLRDRGDNFHHWMTSMHDVGDNVRENPPAARTQSAARLP